MIDRTIAGTVAVGTPRAAAIFLLPSPSTRNEITIRSRSSNVTTGSPRASAPASEPSDPRVFHQLRRTDSGDGGPRSLEAVASGCRRLVRRRSGGLTFRGASFLVIRSRCRGPPMTAEIACVAVLQSLTGHEA
jgi:hypothetical protein